MNKQNKRGASSISSGGLWHKLVPALGASAIILGSLASEANAKTTGHSRAEIRPNRTNVVHGFLPFVFIGDYGGGNIASISSLPQYHPGLWGDRRFGWSHSGYLAPDIVYDMSIAGRKGPDGIPHTGYVTRDIFCMPSTLKSRIVPHDSGRDDIARRYDTRARNLTQRVQEGAEGLSDKERQERYKAAVEFRRSRVKEVRAAEGLNEPALFRQYLDSIGENYSMAPMSVSSQTVALYITLKEYPLVVEWHNPGLMESMSRHKGRAGYCQRHKDELDELRRNGLNVIEITETEPDKIIAKLQEAAIRFNLPSIDANSFLSQIQKSKPYILGPNYKPKK